MNYQSFTIYKKTKENWHPTKNRELRVSVYVLDKAMRVCVWGGDDFGMEKDTPTKVINNKVMLKWIKYAQNLPEPIKRKDLEKLGFVPV